MPKTKTTCNTRDDRPLNAFRTRIHRVPGHILHIKSRGNVHAISPSALSALCAASSALERFEERFKR